MTHPDEDLLEVAERLIAELEAHSDPAVGEKLQTLLAAIDTVHRTGLTRLMAAIHGLGGEALVNRLVGDPAVRLLLMSYDLVAVDRRIQTEEAADAVRGHLHAHGVDIEITEVVGGVVYARLHVQPDRTPNLDDAKRDLQAALKEGLLGFQQLVIRNRETAPSGLVQLGINRGRQPVYVTVSVREDVVAGQLVPVEAEGQSVLLVEVEDEVYAVKNRCGDSPLPLQHSELDGAELKCSWHGCRYDVRTGERLGGLGDRLQIFPVRVERGKVQIAIGTEAVPKAPA